MSHSSLSAQIASLHSKNGISSRQHSDAIGRGVHHSSKAGHRVLSTNVKNKPSVLYPDSKAAAAADVPFTTLRENAVAGLKFLTQHSSPMFDMNGGTATLSLPWKTLFGPKSVKYERGLGTKETNSKFDGLVKQALHLLSTAWGDSIYAVNVSSTAFIKLGSNKPSSVLHVLEYLIQKYYVHVHNAEVLLVSFLPHHETFLFDRILQLVDLAQYPHWSFLRPFSAAKGIRGVPRTVIAKWAATTKDNGGGITIVEKICQVAKAAAKIHSQERANGFHHGHDARQGISISISFAAATLAETFHIQYATNGSIQEQLLRTMVPVIFSSIEPLSQGNNWSLGALCSEWRSFGRIMISLLVEKCEFNHDLNEALIIAVVKGCKECIQLVIRDEKEANGEEYIKSNNVEECDLNEMSSSSKQSILDITSDSILTIMSILQSLTKDPNAKEMKHVQSLVQKVTSSKDKTKEMIGYNLSITVFRSIIEIPYIAVTMGHVYDKKGIDIRPLLASICAMSISFMECKPKSYQKNTNVILELVMEESLRYAWDDKETHLITSLSSFIVQSISTFDSNKAEMEELIQTSLSKILKTLKKIDSSSCNKGIAHAVSLTSSIPNKKQKGKRIQALLQLSEHLTLAIEGEKEKNENMNETTTNVESHQLDYLLPPIMALEHPDTNLRIQAISNLEKQIDDDTDIHEIASALLHRYISDDKAEVAARSVETLKSLHEKGLLSSTFFIQRHNVEEIVSGLKKWTMISNVSANDDDVLKCICTSLDIAALSSHEIIKDANKEGEVEDEQYQQSIYDLVKIISQHISPEKLALEENGGSNDMIVEKAFMSLLYAVGENGDMFQGRNESFIKACENIHFQNVLRACIDTSNDPKESQQFLSFFLYSWSRIPDSYEASRDIQDIVLTVVISFLSTSQDSPKENTLPMEQLSSLRESLVKCVSYEGMEQSIQVVIELSSFSSCLIFDNVSTPVIKKIAEDWSSKSSLLSSSFFLLEAMTRPSMTTVGIERLMLLIDELIVSSQNEADTQSYGLVFMTSLSMCGHSELGIRKNALNLFSKTCKTLAEKDNEFEAIGVSCLSNSPLQANILMDGVNALPQLLQNLILSCENASSASDYFLNSCSIMGQEGFGLLNDDSKGTSDGFFHTLTVLLSAMESAGEKSFPLLKRWEIVGRKLFNCFIEKWPHTQSMSRSARSLLETVALMMKGVTVGSSNHDQGIVITSHVTGSGLRSRSYSVGMSEEISYIDSYPRDMTEAVLEILQTFTEKEMNSYLLEFCEIMIDFVLSRASWVNGVFKKMPKSTRKVIAAELLKLRCKNNVESASLVLMGLKLSSEEIVYLLTSKKSTGSGSDSVGLLSLTVLAECIRQQSDHLKNDDNGTKLYSSLFKRLLLLSGRSISDLSDVCDYTRCCIIQALLPLTTKLNSGKTFKGISDHAKLLVDLLQDSIDDNEVKPLLSSKSKALALQLLTNLCALSPATIVGSLVPAMINTITSSTDLEHSNSSENAMIAIIPTYCHHAPSAGLSLIDLFKAFIKHCDNDKNKSWNQKLRLYTYLTNGLLSCAESDGSAMASLLTAFLANEAFEKSTKSEKRQSMDMVTDETPLSFTLELLDQVEANEKIVCSLQMLRYISNILPTLTGEVHDDSEKHKDFFNVPTAEICSLAVGGKQTSKSTTKQSSSLIWLIVTMLDVMHKNIFSLPLVKRSIRYSGDRQAGICLKVWQELTTLQSLLAYYNYQETSQSQDQRKAKWWKNIEIDVGNILAIVQHMLPTPYFLASVSSLVSDSSVSVDLKKRAMQLLAERSGEVNASSHEATLFLEMIPDLVALAKLDNSKGKENSNEDNDMSILRLTSFRTIEHVAKNLGLAVIDTKVRRKRSALFLPALKILAIFLRHGSSSIGFENIKDESLDECKASFSRESHVLGSAALCTATLITLLEVKCVSQLQSIVKAAISILSTVNDCLRNSENIAIGGTNYQSLKLVQLATMRTLVAVAETMPQFLAPFVETLLSPVCLPSINKRNDSSEEGIAVITMLERLENAIATRSPIHQLIPTLSKSMKICLSSSNNNEGWREALSILKILSICIAESSRSVLTPLAGKVLNTLVQAYSYDCEISRTQLVKEANETLLSMVMKLSESQLRPLYARLREWRGDIESSDSYKKLSVRRYAFWSLSAAMSHKLRNIFLPCMSTVIGDMVKELNYAVSCLCAQSMKKNGNKRMKMQNTAIIPFDAVAISPLQPLLLCLESTLKADAHEGGNWIRSEDGQRYHMLLEPLGKLLQASVPLEFQVTSDERKSASAYEMLIEGVGTEEQGNVSQTITALAAAAGNEQLWKPLNYALLQACGNDKRSEVRKTGVKSLLSIIQTLGEEYMVLLPECLPILSELLEDENEEIIALAKECVHQGEELLGESLEENLR